MDCRLAISFDILNLLCISKRFLQKGNSFVYLSKMKEHDVAIMTSGFSLRHLLLGISVNPVKVFKWFTKLKSSWCSSPLSRTLNVSYFVDRRSSDARTTSIEGGYRIKQDHNSYCSKTGITIYHIQVHLVLTCWKYPLETINVNLLRDWATESVGHEVN